MIKYYKLPDGQHYWADEHTKIEDGSIEIDLQEWTDYLKSIKPPRTWTPRQFLRLFSDDVRLKVTQLAMTNAQVKMWYDDLLDSQEVVESNADLMAGLDALVQAGVLTQADIDSALSKE